MKIFQTLLSFGLILALTVVLIFCGNATTTASNEMNGVPNDVQFEHFQIIEYNIVSATIYTGIKTHTVSGVVHSAEDIKTLSDVLNSATSPAGNVTADYYRLIKIKMKDDSVISLEFGGRGGHFHVLETGVSFKLEPEKRNELNHLVDRLEKEYAN